MTYVELFDKTSIENICAILTDIPKRVVFVGDNKKKVSRWIQYYQKVFSKRGHNIEFECRAVSKWDVDQVVKVLTEIVNTYDDCVFGVTGGDEMALLALGIVYERYRDKNIQIHRIGIRNNKIHDCDKDGNTIYKELPWLTVEENIRIYGGEIEQVNQWDFENGEEFALDVRKMWSICKDGAKSWNIQTGVFEVIANEGVTSEDGLEVCADIDQVREYYKKHSGSYNMNNALIKKMCEQGLLTNFSETENQVTVTYKNLQVKKCLTKAGMALEMMILLAAKELQDENGRPLYNDVVNGVSIDWDGELHEEEDNTYDTINEIDVLMMHNMVPIFVSCKNGSVDMNELYKLNTVAERFGGKYAKKVLIATNLSGMGRTEEYLKQRAQDMNIKILDDLHNMDETILKEKLSKLWIG